MNPTPPKSVSQRWIVAIMVLQCFTLLVALGGLPTASPVEANQQRRDPLQAQDDREQILPNAAAQRAEQIRLLKQISDQLGEMNAGLRKVNDNLAKEQAP